MSLQFYSNIDLYFMIVLVELIVFHIWGSLASLFLLSIILIFFAVSILESPWFLIIVLQISIFIVSIHSVIVLCSVSIFIMLSSYASWASQIFWVSMFLGVAYRFGKGLVVVNIILVKVLIFMFGSMWSSGSPPVDCFASTSIAHSLHGNHVAAVPTRGMLLLLTASSTCLLLSLSLLASATRTAVPALLQYLGISLSLLSLSPGYSSLLELITAVLFLLSWCGFPIITMGLTKCIMFSILLSWSSWFIIILSWLLILGMARYTINEITLTSRWFIWFLNLLVYITKNHQKS